MKCIPIPVIVLVSLSLIEAGCSKIEEQVHAEVQQHHEHDQDHSHPAHTLLVTTPVRTNVIGTEQYVCQIHSRRHIDVCALEGGYLEEIYVQEGQAVRQGDPMFKIMPVIYQAKLNADVAEAELAQIEFDNSKRLFDQRIGGNSVVSDQEVALSKAKLAKALARVDLARAELNFTDVRAPFDGIVDRQFHQQGSLIEEGDILTTMSDNRVMWVYFNVPESRYLDYMDQINDGADEQLHIELKLANGKTFPQAGSIGAIEADFNNETGNIAFRADFANQNGLLRNGQTGTILIHRELKDVVVIPQRATYEILAKQYVYVVGEDNVVHQRDITVEREMEDIFVIRTGLEPGEKIVLEGIRQVRDGDTVEYEYRDPDEVLADLKFHAEYVDVPGRFLAVFGLSWSPPP